MNKRERLWVEWFKEEYVQRTRTALRAGTIPKAPAERVPWTLIEEKGIDIKVVRTDVPGWYDALRSRWTELFPTAWCRSRNRG